MDFVYDEVKDVFKINKLKSDLKSKFNNRISELVLDIKNELID
jgi:hypothetical protein